MNSQLTERITIDPEICHGNPCIRGFTLKSRYEWAIQCRLP
ncbi:DUF433 domain-containing protein [cf. Phormidesmis sp. LEGE 11477]|nr:DUF433 domain-containing protein [cf. Phormidesmis sp. LEGE 11477]